jgi:YegS/Rv2252/BmrU family lipid kinase
MSEGFETFLVVNPRAGGGRTGRRFERIAEAVRAAVGPFEHAFTRGPGHATELAREALEKGFEMVVGVGGDGTFNEVANGFFEGDRPVRPDAVLGVLPRGTGGDFRRTVGIENALETATAHLAGRGTRDLDVGHLAFVGHDGRPAERVFVNIASFGVGGVVVDKVNRAPKILGGRASFALGSLRALAGYRDQEVRLRFEDEEAAEAQPVTNVAVCNGQYFGGGMWAAPKAEVDDALFDVTIWSGFSFKDFVFRSRMLYDGSHVEDPRTRTRRTRRLEATPTGDAVVLLDVDGEQPGRLPATFTVLPAALKLKV